MEQTAQSRNTRVLLRLLEDNDMQDHAQDLKDLLQYVTRMERQCDSIMDELQKIQEQVSKLEDKHSPVVAAFTKAEQKIVTGVEQVRKQLQKLRQTIEDKARSIIEGFRRGGASALRKTLEVLGVRKLLSGIQEELGHAAGGTKRAVERLESMGNELRTASGHLQNAGRAAAGHAPREVEQRPEGRFQSAVLLPMRSVQKTLSKMQVSTATAMYNVARFEQDLNGHEEALALPAPGQTERQAGEESPAFAMTM